MIQTLMNLLKRSRRLRSPRVRRSELGTRIRGLLWVLVGLLLAHIAAMMLFEDLDAGESLWLTLTTVTTVGYGDVSAVTPAGRTATVLLIYLGGIFVLARIASDWFDYRAARTEMMLRGNWRWRMKNHIVLLNSPASSPEQYFERLIRQFRATPELAELPIELLNLRFRQGLPDALGRLDTVHYHGSADRDQDLQAVDIAEASYVVVLARSENDYGSDSLTFDILHRLKDHRVKGRILAECVDDLNRRRLQSAGADVVVRPIRAYPEMIVRALVAPGSERIIETLFTSSGAHYRRYDLTLRGRTWSDIACTLISAGLGTPVAFLDADGEVHSGPDARSTVPIEALILMVQEASVPTPDQVRRALASPS
jgi:voltage-gated potassium channel